MENTTLDVLRSRIDAVDERIIDLLLERMGIVREVGALKHSQSPGCCPIRPGREALQIRRVVDRFKGTHFSPAAAAAIWRSLIMASLNVEGALTLSVAAGAGAVELPWLARDYFGHFLPLAKQPSARRVIGDLLEGKASIGIVPALGDEQTRWWPDWLMLSAGQQRPRIFARLPFVTMGKLPRDAAVAFALAAIEPEETGDDVSLLLLEADESASMHGLQTAFTQAGLTSAWIEVAAIMPHKRHHVVEVQGFISPQHEKLQQVIKQAGSALLNVEWLGAYARPVELEA